MMHRNVCYYQILIIIIVYNHLLNWMPWNYCVSRGLAWGRFALRRYRYLCNYERDASAPDKHVGHELATSFSFIKAVGCCSMRNGKQNNK